MPFMQVKTKEQWLAEADRGVKASEKYDKMSLRDLLIKTRAENEEDYKALSAMLVAFEALGQPISQELKDLADIREIDEVI
jgi:hypothetical protein